MNIEIYRFTVDDNCAYLIEENGHSVLIDAPSSELVGIVRDKRLVLDYIFLTHEHCDHLWGLNDLRENFKPKVIATKETSIAIGNPRTNRANVHHIYITMRFDAEVSRNCTPDPNLKCARAEIEYEGEHCLAWNGHKLKFYATPGHSKGSGMLLIDDEILFAGDTMLKGQKVFTMFEGGNIDDYKNITLPILKTIPAECDVFPGHGDRFYLKYYDLERTDS
jgi:glyoxylase-like metal-dependent hydrolase (beta-lactamase superfamily II)